VAGAIGSSQALLLANHGALTVGETLWRAWERMETVEQYARIMLVARLLGRETELRPEDVARLETLRTPAGYPPPPPAPSSPEGGRRPPSQEELVAIVAQALSRTLTPPA
jgi:L-fuculose-phosphate aldolase